MRPEGQAGTQQNLRLLAEQREVQELQRPPRAFSRALPARVPVKEQVSPCGSRFSFGLVLSNRETTVDADAPCDTFATTRWTQVLVSRGDSAQARPALSDLCAAYYGPALASLVRAARAA